MANNFYQQYYDECRNCSMQINQCMKSMELMDSMDKVEAELTPIDYSFAMLLGLIGAFVTSSKKAELMLDKIHQIASESVKTNDDTYKKVIKFLLGHQGDYIDSVPVLDGDKEVRKFVTRQAKEAGEAYIMNGTRSGPHRIFWGHDIFSLGQDNPFIIMQKQIPGIKGIVQTLKHLTADTFSKQGLPVPSSSWWDYSYTNEKGMKKVGNKLLDYCNKFYETSTSKQKFSVTGGNNDVFNHLFSVHIQDFGTQKIGQVLCDRYLSYKRISNKVVQHQFKLIFSMMLFYMNSLLGAIKYSIPYINWPAALMMIKELFCMLAGSNYETYQLQKITDKLLKETDELESRINYTTQYINRIAGGKK